MVCEYNRADFFDLPTMALDDHFEYPKAEVDAIERSLYVFAIVNTTEELAERVFPNTQVWFPPNLELFMSKIGEQNFMQVLTPDFSLEDLNQGEIICILSVERSRAGYIANANIGRFKDIVKRPRPYVRDYWDLRLKNYYEGTLDRTTFTPGFEVLLRLENYSNQPTSS